jgi:hypothetical protein
VFPNQDAETQILTRRTQGIYQMATLEEATVKVALELTRSGGFDIDAHLERYSQIGYTILFTNVALFALLWIAFEKSLVKDILKQGAVRLGMMQTLLVCFMAKILISTFTHPAMYALTGDSFHYLVARALKPSDPPFEPEKILAALTPDSIDKIQLVITEVVSAAATSTLTVSAALTAGILWLLAKTISATQGGYFERRQEILLICLLVGIDSTPPLMSSAYWAAASGNILPALSLGIL